MQFAENFPAARRNPPPDGMMFARLESFPRTACKDPQMEEAFRPTAATRSHAVLGNLSSRAPKSPARWNDVRAAGKFSANCMQRSANGGGFPPNGGDQIACSSRKPFQPRAEIPRQME